MALREDIKKTLTDSKPLYAVAGAGDLAVKKLREVPVRLQKVSALKVEPKALRDDIQERLSGLPTEVATLPQRAQVLAVTVAVQASETYGDLAKRGRGVVRRIKGQAATQQTAEQAQTTVRRTRTATRTARTSADATQRATRSAAGSASGTVRKAGTAARAGAKKVGTETRGSSARRA